MIYRILDEKDIDFAVSSTRREQWVTESRETFETFLEYDPSSGLIAEKEGQPVGFCVGTAYESSGFFGELIVNPEARGLGLGAQLLKRSVNDLKSRGMKRIYLDGVVPALSLYERHGFKKVCRSLRFKGTISGRAVPNVRLMRESDLPAVFDLDRRVFGEDRRFFLSKIFHLRPELCRVLKQGDSIMGFCLGHRVDDFVRIGPWVADETVRQPESLLYSMAPDGESVTLYMGILESNERAMKLANTLGLKKRSNYCWRMVHGPDSGLGQSAGSLAMGSPAKG